MVHEQNTGHDAPTAGSTAGQASDPPLRIGPYRILEQIGEGGMGVVYLAEQQEPVRRRVALKIIKIGMDTRQVVARFEAERQALAMMDHPNVARVLDAGATDTGRPYFVMEHVPGVPITEHCDRQRLTVEDRLRLFMLVCDAVQHAHQKGIIHRDLKPSNILVSAKDGGNVPKVIDFGVAKALYQKLTERTLFTEQGQLIGTPEYMSPEQAEMTAQDIDTRSDVYSLGVLLYELLTGERPFSSETLRRAGLAEIHRIIRDEEPPKPSTRLSSLGADSTNADHRRADAKALVRTLRGDLDAITMKALEKDRARRYGTASEFAADVERFILGDLVQARAPGLLYRGRRRVRRHRAAYSAIAMLVAIGSVVAHQFITQRDQRSAQASIVRRYAADLDGLKTMAVWYPAVARELAERRQHVLAAIDSRIDTPPEDESAFLADPVIREAFELAWSRLPMPEGWKQMAEAQGLPDDHPPVSLAQKAASIAADPSRPFAVGAGEALEEMRETLQSPHGLEIRRTLLVPEGRVEDGRTPFGDFYRSIQTSRPEDLDTRDLAQLEMALSLDMAFSGFMTEFGLQFPWWWDGELVALTILAGAGLVLAILVWIV